MFYVAALKWRQEDPDVKKAWVGVNRNLAWGDIQDCLT